MPEDRDGFTDTTSGGEHFKWPDVPRLAFGPGPDPLLDARLDWVRDEVDGGQNYYINAYREAIEVLYESAIERRIIVEHAVIPLAFLWRHRIELLLKDIIRAARLILCTPDKEKLSNKASESPTKKKKKNWHDLDDLWAEAKPHIMDLGPAGAPEIINAEETITAFQRIDPGADGFRYPLNTSGGKNLGTAPERINLVRLQDAMEALANFLSAVRGQLGARLAFFLEREHERQLDYGGAISDEQRAEMRRRYMEERRRREGR
jgi:hypothetical protein